MVPLPTRREDRLRIAAIIFTIPQNKKTVAFLFYPNKRQAESELPTTATLLGGTHGCVPYGIIVFSFTFSTFNLIFNQRKAFLNWHLTPGNRQLHFAFRTSHFALRISHFALYIFNASAFRNFAFLYYNKFILFL